MGVILALNPTQSFTCKDKTNLKSLFSLVVHFYVASSSLQAVNELLESLGAPLEIVDGFVSSIAVTIPWQALLTDHCTLEVSGLQITCRPKYRTSKLAEKQPLESQQWVPHQKHSTYIRGSSRKTLLFLDPPISGLFTQLMGSCSCTTLPPSFTRARTGSVVFV